MDERKSSWPFNQSNNLQLASNEKTSTRRIFAQRIFRNAREVKKLRREYCRGAKKNPPCATKLFALLICAWRGFAYPHGCLSKRIPPQRYKLLVRLFCRGHRRARARVTRGGFRFEILVWPADRWGILLPSVSTSQITVSTKRRDFLLRIKFFIKFLQDTVENLNSIIGRPSNFWVKK